MAIHTFGEYLDFHPHLHLLMADGLFLRDERFLVLPENGMDAVEELFRAKLITFLC
ncbi:transposase, partial [Limnospira sp. PMC 1286.21]